MSIEFVRRQVLRLTPLDRVRCSQAQDIVCLGYHVASDEALPHVKHLYSYKSIKQLEQDFIYIKRNFQALSYPEILRARSQGEPLPKNSLMLSFDDGHRECISVIRPLLLKYELPCTFFLTTEALDNRILLSPNRVSLCIDTLTHLSDNSRKAFLQEASHELGAPAVNLLEFSSWLKGLKAEFREGQELLSRVEQLLSIDVESFLRQTRPYLTRQEAQQLVREGFTIGGHTCTHPRLGLLRDPQRIEREIVESCREVASLADSSEVPFAFPFDADGVDRRLLRSVKEHESVVGLLFGTGGLKKEPDSSYLLNRILTDTPPSRWNPGTNLPICLRAEYLIEREGLRTNPSPQSLSGKVPALEEFPLMVDANRH